MPNEPINVTAAINRGQTALQDALAKPAPGAPPPKAVPAIVTPDRILEMAEELDRLDVRVRGALDQHEADINSIDPRFNEGAKRAELRRLQEVLAAKLLEPVGRVGEIGSVADGQVQHYTDAALRCRAAIFVPDQQARGTYWANVLPAAERMELVEVARLSAATADLPLALAVERECLRRNMMAEERREVLELTRATPLPSLWIEAQRALERIAYVYGLLRVSSLEAVTNRRMTTEKLALAFKHPSQQRPRTSGGPSDDPMAA
ncbi:MAG: hypothetical protein F9K18_01120 [Thermoanaerobaculia bacterium]|nr:MAG: hypothetical protein F9K18_01120 [Thermoanaerobaculia bacterium]